METDAKPALVTSPFGTVAINLGCGFRKFIGMTNVDLYGEPDVRWDLEQTPLPFDDNCADLIVMQHVLEHIKNWWALLGDCARVLKVGGLLEIHVPDESSSSAITYRDHHNVFTPFSFHGIVGARCPTLKHDVPFRSGTNAWASTEVFTIPLMLVGYDQTPHKEYEWMRRWPLRYALAFCARHMRNFIWEQQFIFEKVDPAKEVGTHA